MEHTKKKTLEVKNHDGIKVQVTVTIDFSNASDDQMMDWAVSNRVIAGQRAWRDLTVDEIKSSVDGQTFDAVTIGHKIRSREDQIKATMNPALGIDRNTAEWIVDNPEEYKQMLEQMKNKS